jgi:hypothetical protein
VHLSKASQKNQQELQSPLQLSCADSQFDAGLDDGDAGDSELDFLDVTVCLRRHGGAAGEIAPADVADRRLGMPALRSSESGSY